jgi:hypothetical protein
LNVLESESKLVIVDSMALNVSEREGTDMLRLDVSLSTLFRSAAMKISKQQGRCFLAGLVVLAFTLYQWLAGSAGSPGTVPAAMPNLPQEQALDLKDLYLKKNPRRSNLKKEISFRDIDPSIHIEKLEDFDPGTPLNTRNMFSVEVVPERTATARNSKPGTAGSSASLTPGSQLPPTSRPAPTPTEIINDF